MRNPRTITLLFFAFISVHGQAATLEAFLANPTNTNVVILDLRANQIGDEEAIALAEALKVNVTLTKLDLGCNQIGDAGARALAEGLKVNGNLTSLDLCLNQIGEAGARALAEALKLNVTILLLHLDGKQLDFDQSRAWKLLRKSLIRNERFPKVNYYATLLTAGRFLPELPNHIWTEEIFDALKIQIESEIP